MTEKSSEKTEMSSTAFVQMALRDRIAPPRVGSVKKRISHCARQLGWTYSRTKDAWYGDPRISIKADEMRDVERVSGLVYAKQEMRTNDELIAKIDALLEGHDADFYSAFRAALCSALSISHRS